jgi:hypothetical protein
MRESSNQYYHCLLYVISETRMKSKDLIIHSPISHIIHRTTNVLVLNRYQGKASAFMSCLLRAHSECCLSHFIPQNEQIANFFKIN